MSCRICLCRPQAWLLSAPFGAPRDFVQFSGRKEAPWMLFIRAGWSNALVRTGGSMDLLANLEGKGSLYPLSRHTNWHNGTGQQFMFASILSSAWAFLVQPE